jgi:hypothetical protein
VQRKGAWQIIYDTLAGFPAALSAVDRDHRDSLLELLADQPRDEVRWLLFLRNERELADKTGHPEIVAGRCRAMGAMLAPEVAEVVAAEVTLPDAEERREAFAAMARRGVASSRLFLAWAELERGQKSVARARDAIEAGLRAGAPSSPGRLQLEKELDRAKDDLMMEAEKERQRVAAAAAAPVVQPEGTAKKSRTSGLQQRRRLNSIGGPARVKPGAQEALVEAEVEAAVPVAPPEPTIPAVFVPPPLSPRLSLGEQDSDNSSRRKHVTFAATTGPSSPAQAPAGPRPAMLRPGSMSPAPLPSSFTAARHRVAGTTVSSPKQWAESSFAQTPMVGRGGGGGGSGKEQARSEPAADSGASRVLFPSPSRPPRTVEESTVVAASPVAPPVALLPQVLVETAALPKPAVVTVVPPPLARAQQQQKAKEEAEEDAFKRVPGDMVELGKRRLEVLQSLGKGGYSRVFKVLDRVTWENFAMKEVLPPKEKDDRSFANEVAILTRLKTLRLDKEYVVSLAEAHERPDRSIMLLEAGEADLYRLLDRSKRVRAGKILPVTPMTEIRHWWYLLLRCVAKLHVNGVVHCDLKVSRWVSCLYFCLMWCRSRKTLCYLLVV